VTGGLIDLHSHLAPLRFPADPSPGPGSRWPCIVCGGGQATVTFGGKPFRKLDSRSWDAARRLEDMDRDGVAQQVLSPMPELLSYWISARDAAVLCDHVNAEIAAVVAAYPQRFRGLGMVPMQAPGLAVAALAELKARFGLAGIEIGSNIDGALPGDPKFEPVWAAAQDLDLSVFIHPLHPVATRGLDVTPAFTAFAGFPLDVALAGASLLTAGVCDRYPRLRIALSHGGGALGAMLGRLDQGWRFTDGFGRRAERLPSEVARSLFFDSNVYDAAYLKHLAQTVAPGQVFVGTDYPYDIMQQDPGGFLAAAGLTAENHRSVARGAALRFLGAVGDD
jgi:aminocarboxymuconate-semialdehyde decarboxylase